MARAFVIGLDGVPFELLTDLAERGIAPRMASFLAESRFRRIRSTIPPLSSVAWSTVLTGVDPGTHGIFGFVEIDPWSYRYTVSAVTDLRAPPLWQTLGAARKRCAFLNVPSTYPAQPLDGVMVSGFVAPDLSRAVQPPALAAELAAAGYAIDVDARLGHEDLDAFFDDVERTLERRSWLVRRVWDAGSWDLFMVVFTETDRLLHFCFDAWRDARNPRHERFLRFFGLLDAAVGAVLDLAAPGDVSIMLSDHGFGPLLGEVYTNEFLVSQGFARFRDGRPRDLSSLEATARAFALDPGRIYVHRKDRYARGCVEDGAPLIDAMGRELARAAHAGERLAGAVLRGAEVYRGPYAARGPDLVVEGTRGYDWKGRVGAGTMVGSTAFTGCHTGDNAFLAIRGAAGDEAPEPADLTAVAGLVKRSIL
jgi:predicted AlkP superfamily phosphohydrolase/phosphomutase